MSIQYLRVLTDEGLIEFARIISEIRNGNQKSIPETLLYDSEFSAPFEEKIEFEKVEFFNKNELIPYIAERLNLTNNKHLYFNKHMWSWLAAFYFDLICPKDGNGNRKVNESAFYVLNDPRNYTKYYRHLIAYPCRIFAELGDSSKIFLIGNFKKRGEVTEQFGAYQEISLNKGILDMANILYWDENTKNLKRGAAGKGGGSARRLVRIIRQYQMTYDLNSMNGKEIAELLPPEFDKWKNEN